MDNENIARSAKSIDPNEEATTGRFHADRVGVGDGDFCPGCKWAHRHVQRAYPDSESSVQIQVSGPGRTNHRAPADKDDRKCRGLSDLRVRFGFKVQLHARVDRAGSYALDAPTPQTLTGHHC